MNQTTFNHATHRHGTHVNLLSIVWELLGVMKAVLESLRENTVKNVLIVLSVDECGKCAAVKSVSDFISDARESKC